MDEVTKVVFIDIEDPSAEEEEDGWSVKYDIIAHPNDWSLQSYKDKWDRGDVFIPEYQREYVWKPPRASRLIESFLIGLPVPQVFLYETPEKRHEVVDGHQRLRSIFDFMDDSLTLQGINDGNLRGKCFSALNGAQRRTLENSTLRGIVVREFGPDKNKAKFQIFERLNTGGLALKPQEIRNCIYTGPFNKVLAELNNDANWRRIIGNDAKDKHKRDIELILRVFALSQTKPFKRPLKNFLNEAMEEHLPATSGEVMAFCNNFPKCTKIVIEKLGERPFHLRRSVNAPALDSVVCAVLGHIHDDIPGNLRDRYQLLVDSGIIDDNNTSAENAVRTRLKKAEEYLFGSTPSR